MAEALRLAERGRYTADPNPAVGCVVVQQGRIVGRGFHARAGEAHAEVYALREAGNASAGATVYVTLEPCSHYGRTPPCAKTLIRSGVARAVVAQADPNPEVAGRGLEQLRSAGIATRVGVLEEQARRLNRGFHARMAEGRPWTRIKLAMSLDGRTAMASGESQWITGAAARRDVQYLRAQASAVLTGSGTVVSDDPSLNVRLTAEELAIDGAVRQPVRVIVDSQLRTPASARTLSLPGHCLILTAGDDAGNRPALEAAGAEVVTLPPSPEGVDLHAALTELGRRGANEVHVEAGSVLCGGLLAERLVDELVIYVSAHIMGEGGKGLFRLPGLETMAERIPMRILEIRAVGEDWRIRAAPASQ